MKKLILVMAVLFTAVSFGQRVQEGDAQLNAGIGFTSGWGLPFYVGFDYGVHPDITVGGQVTYASTTENYGHGGDYKYTWFGIGANANYHFNTVLEIPNEWDVYAGATLGYDNFSGRWVNSNYNGRNSHGYNSGLGFAGQIGARYYFSDNVGLNLEFGGGNVASGGKIGISFKL